MHSSVYAYMWVYNNNISHAEGSGRVRRTDMQKMRGVRNLGIAKTKTKHTHTHTEIARKTNSRLKYEIMGHPSDLLTCFPFSFLTIVLYKRPLRENDFK